jgi:hypothetical protein
VTTTGAARPNADIAIGGSIGSGIVKALLPSIPLIVLGFGGSLVVFILRVTSRRRRQARRGLSDDPNFGARPFGA